MAVVLTAAWVHAEQAIRAMKHGKHALVEKPMAFPHRWHRMQIEDLCRAVRENREPAVNGFEARKLDAICESIYESGRTGELVNVPEGAT